MGGLPVPLALSAFAFPFVEEPTQPFCHLPILNPVWNRFMPPSRLWGGWHKMTSGRGGTH